MKSVSKYNARLKKMNETVKKIKPISSEKKKTPSKPLPTKA
jgi:hypothetical protein